MAILCNGFGHGGLRFVARAISCMPVARMTSFRIFLLLAGGPLALAACTPPAESPDEASPATVSLEHTAPETAAPPPNPLTQELLPEDFRWLWEPWTGDLPGIVERRALRVLLPYGGYQFYFENGRPRGATFEMLRQLERFLNAEFERRHVRIHIVPIPVSREQLIPGLLGGFGDLVATDLTVTPKRRELVAFTRPLLTDIREVVVLGPHAAPLESLDALAGREVFVRPTSSYAENLEQLSLDFERRGLEPPRIKPADEMFEAEDILDMLRTGAENLTVMDDYKARFWAKVIDGVEIREDLVVHEGGEIAWALRKEDTELAATLDRFMRKYGRGSAFGNDVYNRYLDQPEKARCSRSAQTYADIEPIVAHFMRFGEMYGFNWTMLAAQGYQESGLRQNRRSHAGAVGIMQIKPSTAADPNVGIDDISTAENNIHAGAKYLRFISDRYFSDAQIADVDRWLFSLAAYNAGPARIASLRREAQQEGLDPNRWHDNVELVAARRIGRETVQYVSNVYRLYIAYDLTVQRGAVFNERYGEILTHCNAQDS